MSFFSNNPACVGELVLNTPVNLHQKQMVVPLYVEKLRISASTESLQRCWCGGHGVKDKERM